MYYKNFLAQVVDDDVIVLMTSSDFQRKVYYFQIFLMTFLVFCLRFCLQADFFFRSVNIGYYLKSWSNGAPNRH